MIQNFVFIFQGGKLDVLVCSAGISLPREFEHTTSEEFDSVIRLNLHGSRNATIAALAHMDGPGRIVFVSSQAGQVGLYGYTAYSVSSTHRGLRKRKEIN